MSIEKTTIARPPQGSSGRAADNLFRTFADQIKQGVLKDGDVLPPEREIVERYGVSRTVAREAVQALANRGLVEARPRHRPVVRQPSYDAAMDTVQNLVDGLLAAPDGVRALFEIRVLIEVALAREAAVSASKSDIAKMKSALDANKAAIHDSETFYHTDRAFHAAFHEMSGNPALAAIHKAYATWLHPQWSQMPRLPGRNSENYAAHAAVFEAVLMRDPDAAEAAMRAHLDAAWEQVKETF